MSDEVGDLFVTMSVDASAVPEQVSKAATEAGTTGGQELASTFSKMFAASIAEALKPSLDGIKEQVTATVDELSALRIDLAAKASTDAARAEIDALVEEEDGRDIEIDPVVDKPAETSFLARIKELTATAIKKILVVQEDAGGGGGGGGTGGGAQDAAGDAAKAASGAESSLNSVIKSFLKFASVGTLVSTGLAPLMTLSADIAPLASNLISLWPIVLAGGPALGAVGAAAGVVITAFKTMSTSSAPQAKAFAAELTNIEKQGQSLSKVIDSNFFGPITAPLKTLVGTLFPQLQTGLGAVSSALGGDLGAIATGLNAAFGNGVVTKFLADVATAFKNAQPGITAFAQGFGTIITKLAPILPSMGTAITNIGKAFQTWTANANFAAMFQTALTGIKELVSIGGSAVSIIKGIFDAIASAGQGTGLAGMASALQKVADVINGPAFQKGLGSFFSAASIGMTVFLGVVGPLGTALAQIGPILGIVIAQLASTGQTLIAGLLPPVTELINVALPVFAGLVKALAPVFLDLVTAVLPLVTALLPPLAALIEGLIPIFGQIVTALQPFAVILVTGLLQAFNGLLPVIPVFVQALGQILTGLTPLLPVFADVLQAVAPLAQILGTVLVGALNVLMPILAPLSKVVVELGAAIVGLVAAFKVYDAIMAVVDAVTDASPFTLIALAIVALIAGIVLLVTHWQQVVTFLTGVFGPAWNAVVSAFKDGINWIGSVATGVWDKVTSAWNGFTTWVKNFWSGLLSFFATWGPTILAVLVPFIGIPLLIAQHWGDIVTFFQELPGKLGALLADAGKWLLKAGEDMLSGLVQGIVISIYIVKDLFTKWPQEFAQWLVAVVPVMLQQGKDFLTGLYNGMVTGYIVVTTWLKNLPADILTFFVNALIWLVQTGTDLLTGLQNGILTGYVAVTKWFTALPGEIWNFLVGFDVLLLQKGIDLLTGVQNGVNTGWTGVSGWFKALPGNIINFLVGFDILLVTKGLDLLTGLRNGITSGWNGVVSWFKSLPGAITSAVGDASSWLVDTGKNIVAGLQRGIANAWNAFSGWVQAQIDKIPKVVRDALGIQSPSKVMAEIGGHIVSGLKQGIDNNAASAVASMQKLANQVSAVGGSIGIPELAPGTSGVGPGVNSAPGATPFAGQHPSSSTTNTMTNNFNFPAARSPQKTAKAVIDELTARVAF